MPALTVFPLATPSPQREIVMPETLTVLAERAGIPRIAVSRDGMPMLATLLHQQAVDLAVVACWPWRIPRELLPVPRYGFLNLHPSPLPELRGPEPLFWALRLGWTRTAMTLHLMDEEFDHGPIVCQEWFELPAGERLSILEQLAGQQAAQMLPKALTDLQTPGWQPQPQTTAGSFLPTPREEDFTFSADWPVQRAYAFARAIAEWGRPFTFTAANGQTLAIVDVIACQPGMRLAAPIMFNDDQVALQLSDGALIGSLPTRQ